MSCSPPSISKPPITAKITMRAIIRLRRIGWRPNWRLIRRQTINAISGTMIA